MNEAAAARAKLVRVERKINAMLQNQVDLGAMLVAIGEVTMPEEQLSKLTLLNRAMITRNAVAGITGEE